MRHREANTNGVDEVYRRAREQGIDLDSLSNMNFVRVFAEDLKGIERGRKIRFSQSTRHRLHVLSLVGRRLTGERLRLTEKGRRLLAELEAEAKENR